MIDFMMSDPGTAFGRSRLCVACFSSEEEAVNALSYLRTDFAQKILRITASGKVSALAALLPDLGDYTSTNENIRWDEPLDEQLYALYGISEEDMASVEAI